MSVSRIQEAFAKGKVFIPFVTAGDPDLETTGRLVLAMAEAGADIIELGIPFSDPVAEGPVIQAASERALAAGVTTDKLFDLVKRLRERTQVPLCFMTYVNPIFTYGVERFMKHCRDCGVDGVIVPDLPFEEKRELAPACEDCGVDLISLIAPTSHERIQAIAREAKGFVYCVSSLGVTGVREHIAGGDVGEMVRLVKSSANVPCAVGFGISTPDQAKAMAAVADGAIVGSAIVKMVARYGRDSVEPVAGYVRQMKAAVASAAMESEKALRQEPS